MFVAAIFGAHAAPAWSVIRRSAAGFWITRIVETEKYLIEVKKDYEQM
jgi:hypothetical protein